MDGWMDAMREAWLDACSDLQMPSEKVLRAFSEGGHNLGAVFRPKNWGSKVCAPTVGDHRLDPQFRGQNSYPILGPRIKTYYFLEGGEGVIDGENESGGWMGDWMGLGPGMNGWMDRRKDGRTDGCKDGWMDGWMGWDRMGWDGMGWVVWGDVGDLG